MQKPAEIFCLELRKIFPDINIFAGGSGVTKFLNAEKKEIDDYRSWLSENGYSWEDPKLSLGHIKIGQVDLQESFGDSAKFRQIYETVSNNLNITKIKIISNNPSECEYPYTLDSDDWQQIQMEGLRRGYEQRSMR